MMGGVKMIMLRKSTNSEDNSAEKSQVQND